MRTLMFTVSALILFTSQLIASPDSALLEAVGKGDIEAVQKLVDTGVDLNVRNDIERTALIVATLNGHAEIAQILIDAGADANASNYCGETALMVAVGMKYAEIVELLLQGGADVNAQGNHGRTALMVASEYGFSDIVKFLLKNGAEVNARDVEGETALMHTLHNEALIHGKIPEEIRVPFARAMVVIIQELVAAGADVNATNNFGETALMKAKAVKGGKGRGMIISALREAGAEE